MGRLQALCVFACLLSAIAAAPSRKMEQQSRSEVMKGNTRAVEKNITRDEVMAKMIECNNTYPVPFEVMVELNLTGKFPPTATRDAKCYLKCFFTQLEVLDESNNLNESQVETFFADGDEELAKDFIRTCSSKGNVRTEDNCERAYEKMSCLMIESIDHFKDDEDSGIGKSGKK
ncbi:UNVERIFIED_CONTAM: hypothetical protein PYX00_001262 [Menopon gallinae]|uniref:Uncharacterized protein n=1 Tax=Menopon gallinae TaxID=328185 RepID=A0AAW2IBN2_9NEOP